MSEREPPRVIWAPLPGSQAMALSCPCDEILYEGTRGPGKTDAQLMFFRKHVGMGYGRFWRGIIFDREYKNLDDLIGKSQRWFPEFDDKVKFLASKSDYRWVWPTGEELLFRQIKKSTDYWNYHGQEFPFIGWNELSKYPTPELYDALLSCNRTSFIPTKASGLAEIPLVIFSTTNPYGAGHNWVKARFIDAAPPGTVVKRYTNVFNPRTSQREDVVRTQVRLFGSYKENTFLSPQYIAQLENIKDENKRKAWLWGDWDIVAGGALDDVWTDAVIKPRFKVPETWRIDRSFDWGSSHPFSTCWWAEANGEEATLPNGSKFCPVAGSLIQLGEWYGTKEIGSNAGLKMSGPDVARGVLARDEKLLADGWIETTPEPGPADNQIRDVREKDVDTIAKKMEDEGVFWLHSDKSPGSRKNGLQLVRDRLQSSATGIGPGLYFMDNCKATLATLPVLPRDEDDLDDVDTDSEDHIYDAVRYRVLHGNNRYATKLNIKHVR